MAEESGKIRITFDDIERVSLQTEHQVTTLPSSPGTPADTERSWGTVPAAGAAAADPSLHRQRGSILLQGWFYLGLAGLAGAFLAWALCEPTFNDEGPERFGNFFIFPLMLTFVCTGLATAESIVERSVEKAVRRGVIGLIVGLVLGYMFTVIANVLFNVLLRTLAQSSGLVVESPSFWLCRAIAWMAFGLSGGLAYGIVGQSGRKCLYGVIGGVVGAGIGGFVFDPISLLMGGAGLSRMVGLSTFGVCTGVAVGLVESALKDRWLYVSGGPLAGKQFILYKPVTALGSQQSNDIYLFKDLSIQAVHATIEIHRGQAYLFAKGPTTVGGRAVAEHLLRSGDVVQIGRYSFTYLEKNQPH